MKYRNLGSSDLSVSEISLGSWGTYGVAVENEKARKCVERALDLGVNFFDTANVYGHGSAELFLGEVLSARPRDSYLIGTKLFFEMPDGSKGLSAKEVEKQLNASLERLRTDYIDLYQCHRYDPDTPLEETIEALTKAVESGKVREIGFSEWPVEKVREACEMAGVKKFVSSQPQYSMLWREPEEELIPLCQERGISQIVWSPLAQGVLTGKYKPNTPPPSDSRIANPTSGVFIKRWSRPEAIAAVDALRPLAEEAGVSLAQFALAWVLRIDNVASAIVGASRPEQVEQNVVASQTTVDPELFAQAERIIAAADV